MPMSALWPRRYQRNGTHLRFRGVLQQAANRQRAYTIGIFRRSSHPFHSSTRGYRRSTRRFTHRDLSSSLAHRFPRRCTALQGKPSPRQVNLKAHWGARDRLGLFGLQVLDYSHHSAIPRSETSRCFGMLHQKWQDARSRTKFRGVSRGSTFTGLAPSTPLYFEFITIRYCACP